MEQERGAPEARAEEEAAMKAMEKAEEKDKRLREALEANDIVGEAMNLPDDDESDWIEPSSALASGAPLSCSKTSKVFSLSRASSSIRLWRIIISSRWRPVFAAVQSVRLRVRTGRTTAHSPSF